MVDDSADMLGQIDDPPDSPQKPDSLSWIQNGGTEIRNWMKLGADVDPVGNGFKKRSRWQLSGTRGWNEVVHSHSTNDQANN